MKSFLIKILCSLGLSLCGTQALAKLFNGGIYVSNQNAVPGTVLSLSGTIYSDSDQSNVTVTLGIHRVDNNVVASSPVASQVFAAQNFSAGQRLNYFSSYTMSASLPSGTYILVMKAGTAANNSDYILVQNPQDYPVTFTAGSIAIIPVIVPVQPAPPAPISISNGGPGSLLNAGIYIPNKSASAGSSITIHNAVTASQALSGVSLKMELHRILDSGAIDSSAVVTKLYSSLNFYSGEQKTYVLDYAIPSSAYNGKYILSVLAASADGTVTYLSYSAIADINTFVISGGQDPSVVSPPVTGSGGYVAGLANSGVYVETASIGAGAYIKIHNSFAASTDLSNVLIQMEVHSASNPSGAAISSQSFSGVSFSAGENKVYVLSYELPGTLPSGPYFLAVKALNSSGQYYVNLNSSVGYNAFTVVSTADAKLGSVGSADTSGIAISSESYLRGINVMDAAIGSHSDPGSFGTNFTTPSLEALKLLKGRGLSVIRLPIMWERMQKSLGGSLDSEYLGYIMQALRDANTAGMKIIVDLHNYGRYTSNGTESMFGDSSGPSQAQFADLWKKLAVAIKADSSAYSSVYAYDVMNEPHDLPTVNGVSGNKIWEQYAQAAVSGIRAVGDTKLIHVEGYNWASPLYFANYHPTRFITDSANNMMYQAHLYMDDNAGGVYSSSFAYETAQAQAQGHASVAARGIYRLKQFSNWCSAQQARCFVGEYGWPNSATVGTAEANLWNQAGDLVLRFMDNLRIGATMWATGSWLSPTDNIMNAYTLPGRASYSFAPLSQSSVLEAHPGQ